MYSPQGLIDPLQKKNSSKKDNEVASPGLRLNYDDKFVFNDEARVLEGSSFPFRHWSA